jgi:hypothetical protein
VQYVLFVSTTFEVLEGPLHGNVEQEKSNGNERHNDPCSHIVQHRNFWCNNQRGSILSAATVSALDQLSDSLLLVC